MFNGNGRWYWLTSLALVNLVLWVAIAAVVGLLLSDQLDLGLETELRQAHATAVAAWKEFSERQSAPSAWTTSLARGPRPADTRSSTRQPQPTPAVYWSEPAASSTGMATAERPAAPQATTTSLDALPGGELQTAPISSSQPRATASPSVTPSAGTEQNNGSPAATSSTDTRQDGASAAGRPAAEPTQLLLLRPLLLADPEIHNLAGLNAEMARSAPGRVVQIRYQEEVLNRELNALCESNPEIPFRNVQADLKREQVVLTGEITVLGFEVEATVAGTIVAEDCRPKFDIEAVTVAGILTPQFVRAAVGREVLKAVDWYPADYPLCLEEIVLEEDRATIYGYNR